MNSLGITGTQKGMTEKQYTSLRSVTSLWTLLTMPRVPTLHHGCCIGVDEQTVNLAFGLGYYIIGHPPVDQKKMSTHSVTRSNELREPKEYLDRNRDIAIECDVLIAVPETYFEVLRSGTWATVRSARALKKIIIIIWPDGSVEIPEYT